MQRALFLALALAPLSRCAVEELTAWSFDAFADSHRGPIVLEFYAPWCAHCAAYAPHYARAAELGQSLASWARVDGSRHYSLSLRFAVAGFPTLFYLGEAGSGSGRGGAREVRRLALTSQSHEGVLEYARGGWRLQALEGQDWWRGPWGPLALAKFHAARAYEAAFAVLEAPAAAFDIPAVAVQFALVFFLLCACTSAVVTCSVWCGAGWRAARRKAYLAK